MKPKNKNQVDSGRQLQINTVAGFSFVLGSQVDLPAGFREICQSTGDFTGERAVFLLYFEKIFENPQQIEVEARVGIDRVSSSTSHSKSIVYGIADCMNINGLR
jgi:hypothetical protein